MPDEPMSAKPKRDQINASLSPEHSSRNLVVTYRAVDSLNPCERNARAHSKKQIRQVANSIKSFGFLNPVLIDADDTVIAGHCRLQAAKLLGLATIPVIRLSHLSEVERRAYMLADNKLALNA